MWKTKPPSGLPDADLSLSADDIKAAVDKPMLRMHPASPLTAETYVQQLIANEKPDRYYTVYFLLHPKTFTIHYVGVTNSPARRFFEHCTGSSSSRVSSWVAALWPRLPFMQPVCLVETESMAEDIERWLITKHPHLLNVLAGGRPK